MINDRPGPHYSEFFRRLRARPLSSWSVGQRVTHMRLAIEQLAELGRQSGQPAPVVPDLGAHVLADQLEVLLQDAIRAGADQTELGAVIEQLADQLSVRLD